MRAMARRRFISLSLAAFAAGLIAARAREHDAPGGIAYGKAPRQRLDVIVLALAAIRHVTGRRDQTDGPRVSGARNPESSCLEA